MNLIQFQKDFQNQKTAKPTASSTKDQVTATVKSSISTVKIPGPTVSTESTDSNKLKAAVPGPVTVAAPDRLTEVSEDSDELDLVDKLLMMPDVPDEPPTTDLLNPKALSRPKAAAIKPTSYTVSITPNGQCHRPVPLRDSESNSPPPEPNWTEFVKADPHQEVWLKVGATNGASSAEAPTATDASPAAGNRCPFGVEVSL